MESKNLAITVSYLLQEPFYIFDNKFDSTKKVYSFKDNDKFRKILTLVRNVKNNN
ncbi:hypothetical protein [Clostridium gelidum]|nr:hypothetical protein [Clostridium gelidum]